MNCTYFICLEINSIHSFSGKGTGAGDHDQLHFNIKIKSGKKVR